MAFGFLNNLLRGDDKPGGGLLGFLDDVRKTAQSADKSANRYIEKSLASAGKGTKDFVIGAARDTARFAPTLVTEAYNRSMGTNKTIDPSKNKLTQALFGSDEIGGLAPEAQRQLGSSSGLAQGAILGFGFLDVLPGGKAASKPLKGVLKKLISETSQEGVEKVLKDVLPEAVVKKTALAIANTKDPRVITDILQKAAGERAAVEVAQEIPQQAAKQINDITPGAALDDPLERMYTAMRGQKSAKGQVGVKGMPGLRKEQDALYSAERTKRLAEAKAAREGLAGREAYGEQLQKLAGELPKVDATNLLEHVNKTISPEDVDNVMDILSKHPNLAGYEHIRAQGAVDKFFNQGQVLQPSEWDLLEKALGPDFTDTMKATASLYEKSRSLWSRIIGAPKSLLSSIDLSGPGRQGAALGSRFREDWKNAFTDQLKYFGSDDAFKASMDEISSRETFGILKDKMKLALTGITDELEEKFVSDIPEKIPGLGRGVKASTRAYTGSLTKLRADVGDRIINEMKEAGIDLSSVSDKAWQDIGEFINTFSGRGGKPGGWISRNAEGLGQALFSPRLWASRLQMLNPVFYARLDPIAKKYALQSAASFASITGAVLGLAAMAGAEVSTDPESSDFLKIKIGDTRYDIMGGLQQNIVLASRLWNGEKTSAQTGKVQEFQGLKHTLGLSGSGEDRTSITSPTGVDLVFDFVQNKADPFVGLVGRLLGGEDRAGQPINVGKELAGLVTPLSIQSAYEQATHPESTGISGALPELLGVSVQTFGEQDIAVTDVQDKYLEGIKEAGVPDEIIKSHKSFFQKLKSGPDRSKASEKINEFVDTDPAKAQEIANQFNVETVQHMAEWLRSNSQYMTPELSKLLNSQLITLDSASIKTRIREKQKIL